MQHDKSLGSKSLGSMSREPASSGAVARSGNHGIKGVGLIGAIALAALIVAPVISGQAFYLHLAVLVAINVIAVSGLSLLTRAGQVSLCHGAFIGLGAYASVLLSMRLGFPFLLAALSAMVFAAVIAFLLGAVILRLRGVYFVLVTFAFGELVRLVFLEWEDLTGGANGIANVPPASVPGVTLDTKLSFYVLAAVLALGCIGFIWALFRTPAGHTVDAVGENGALAEASGLSVHRTQLFAFTVGSALAGLAGSLNAHYVGYVSPESFNFSLSVTVIIMMVVGGRYYVIGPLIGALVMTPLPEFFRGAVQSQNIFYGVALILMLRFMPQGLAGLGLWRRLAVRSKDGDASGRGDA